MIVTITSWAPNLVLRYAGTAPTTPPAQPSRDHAENEGNDERRADGKRETCERGRKTSRSELALASNVEQPSAETERNGESSEGECGRLVENLTEPVGVSPGSFEQQPVHSGRRLSVTQDQQVPANESDEERDERRN